MFISFAYFYSRFFKGISKIVIQLTSILKITRLLDLVLKVFKADKDKIVSSDDRANKMIVNLSRNLTYISNIKALKKSIFLILNTKKAFNYLKQAFIKVFIL